MPLRKLLSSRAVSTIFSITVPENRIYCVTRTTYTAYAILEKYAQELDLEILVWCFMPNHYHWLVLQRGKHPALKLPYHVFNVYQVVQQNHDERGTLFESRFKVKPVTTLDYLAQLCMYIHANPVK